MRLQVHPKAELAEQLEAEIQAALEFKGPALVEVMTDAELI